MSYGHWQRQCEKLICCPRKRSRDVSGMEVTSVSRGPCWKSLALHGYPEPCRGTAQQEPGAWCMGPKRLSQDLASPRAAQEQYLVPGV